MLFFYLFLAMVFSAMITFAGRFYDNAPANGTEPPALYSALVALFAALSWGILWCGDFSFALGVLPYSLLYGLGYTSFTIGLLGAIKTGSTSLTALIKQASLVGVSFWGFAFWGAPITLQCCIGIALLLVSLPLCLLTKETKSDSHHLPKWLLFSAMIVVGNAGCSIVQRYQQMAFNYQHKNMFMFFGVLFSFFACALLVLRPLAKHPVALFGKRTVFPAMAGMSSALSNVFILLLIKKEMSSSVLYPGIAVGGLMITTIVAFSVFRERLRPLQWIGLVIGAVGLVLLNL